MHKVYTNFFKLMFFFVSEFMVIEKQSQNTQMDLATYIYLNRSLMLAIEHRTKHVPIDQQRHKKHKLLLLLLLLLLLFLSVKLTFKKLFIITKNQLTSTFLEKIEKKTIKKFRYKTVCKFIHSLNLLTILFLSQRRLGMGKNIYYVTYK